MRQILVGGADPSVGFLEGPASSAAVGIESCGALLISVTVCSTQVATFFLLSNLGLVHSVLDTTRLPSAYAPLHSWIWDEHWMGIFLSEWS